MTKTKTWLHAANTNPGKTMRLIKRYSNRKLYDTTTRTYITLDGIAALVQEGTEIKVVDNDTDEDLTAVIFSQLLVGRARSRSLPSSGLLSGLLRSGETLSRNLPSLPRPNLPLGPANLLNMLENEIERSLKFWLEVGQDNEEDVLKLIDGLVDRWRGKSHANPPGATPAPETPRQHSSGLLRRLGRDEAENRKETHATTIPITTVNSSGEADLTTQATTLAQRAIRLAETLHHHPPADPATSQQLKTALNEIDAQLTKLEAVKPEKEEKL
jgi:polyhydroxyalkanoate synthesis repressor PhaR